MTSRGRTLDPEGPRLTSAGERWDKLLGWLAAEGRIDVVDAAGRLGVAQETVRRDLRALENQAKLLRVHGGAVSAEDEARSGGSLSTLALPPGSGAGALNPSADDRALVELLWAKLPHTGTVLLGTGRLTLELAQVIVADPPATAGLTVVTNSLDVGLVLSRASRISVYNIGGTVSPLTRAQEGDWALSELQRLHTDVSVVCPAGLTVDRGLSQQTPAAAAVSQAEVAAGERVVALVEEAALGRASFVTFAELAQVDEIIVAGEPAAALLAAFVERGVECTSVPH